MKRIKTALSIITLSVCLGPLTYAASLPETPDPSLAVITDKLQRVHIDAGFPPQTLRRANA